MKRLMIGILASVSTTLTSFAADATFPSAGGDIASDGADGWNGTKPAATEIATFDKVGTYVASEDVAFKSVVIKGNDVLFDFASYVNPLRKVSLGGADWSFYTGAKDSSVELKGGLWDLGGKAFSVTGTGWVDGRQNDVVTLSGGVCVTNVSSVRGSYGNNGTNIVLRLKEGSSFYSKGRITMSYDKGKDRRIEVLSGSRLIVESSDLRTDSDGAFYSSKNTVLVSGTNSYMKLPTLYCGMHHADVLVRATDSGAIDVTGSTHLGWGSGTTRCRIVVDDGGVFNSNSTFYFGGDGTQTSAGTNSLEVLGGAVNVNGAVYLGGCASSHVCCHDSIVVSNGTLDVSRIHIGLNSGSNDHVVRLIGKDTVFNCSFSGAPYYIFCRGDNNLLELDGATWDYKKGAMCFNYNDGESANLNGSNNVVRLMNEANLRLTSSQSNWFSIGSNDPRTIGNRLELLSGSTVSVGSFEIRSSDNLLSVSNATLNCTAMTVGNPEGAGDSVVIRGDDSAISVTNAVKFRSSASLRFEIPVGGLTCTPITCGSFTMDASSSLTVDADACVVALREAGMTANVRYTLVESETAISIPDEVLAAANAKLPEGCKLVFADDGKKLVLRVSAQLGLTILLK